MVVASPQIALSGNFPYAALRGGCLCYSSMLSEYASVVAVMQWIGRRATGNNEHVWYTVLFLIECVFILLFWCGPIAVYGKGSSVETGG